MTSRLAIRIDRHQQSSTTAPPKSCSANRHAQEAKTIRHDAHKEHPLVLVDSGEWGSRFFTCGGCGCPGGSPRHRCAACDFDLHELCATAPRTASFFFHGQHPLAFELGPDDDHRGCDVCGTPIRGMHYRCRPCDFDVHPVCSQLPGAAVSPLHPEHLLMLNVGVPKECARCGSHCVWRYTCGVCWFYLHPRCLLGTDQTPLNIPKPVDLSHPQEAGQDQLDPVDVQNN
ncbi:hypothetical protein HU200_025446 [Digitaria exilis]|uniref:DC1 domain-containing protein n=1 Tax=Digitaria exilis TaxID=1010633 RepID=A0A835EW26_9POAL|nr:hypothetical protein HU200_025446 [Digitaria exilis]